MKALRPASVVILTFLTISCSEHASVGPTPIGNDASGTAALSASSDGSFSPMASTPQSATIQFGLVDVGSGFPPSSGHDQSGHANDTLVPGTVVIDKGGTVTFNTPGIHQVAIYEPGVEPADIDTSILTTLPAGCPPLPLLINDPTGRLALLSSVPGCGPRTLQYTFNQPGRHLVICAFLPHFEIKMYGWVIVRDR